MTLKVNKITGIVDMPDGVTFKGSSLDYKFTVNDSNASLPDSAGAGGTAEPGDFWWDSGQSSLRMYVNDSAGWFKIGLTDSSGTSAGGAAGRSTPEALVGTFATSDDTWAVGDTVNYTTSNYSPSYSYYSFSPSYVLFPVRNGVEFRIKLYGGSGGSVGGNPNFGGNANGGIVDATVDLSAYADTDLYIYLGGAGQNSSSSIDGSSGRPYGAAGQNGGGQGAGTRGPSGGGRTDLRTSTSTTSELMVAAGGGGGWGSYGTSSQRVNGYAGLSGYTGSYARDNGGGGGGYYGGNASSADDGSNGGTGSNYIASGILVTSHQNSTYGGTSGGNQGNGYFSIEVISVS